MAIKGIKKMTRGMKVKRSGTFVSFPASPKLLGRVLDTFGEPQDNLGNIKDTVSLPIHAGVVNKKSITELQEPVETGIKVIDLFCPLLKGGKIGLFGGAGVGKTMLLT